MEIEVFAKGKDHVARVEALAPLAIEDRPPTAGTVGMRAMTLPPGQTRK